jgi:4'-phosphopantetheinyl transferase
MIAVYIYEGDVARGEKGYPLIYRAAASYCADIRKTDEVKEFHIKTGEHGKPYFVEGDPYFSVSHSGNMWMCAVSDLPCGIDLEEVKKRDYEKVAHRIFSGEDLHYIDLWGSYGFFNLWTRMEAFVKWKGTGISDDLPPFTRNGELLSELLVEGKTVGIRSIEISDDIYCSVCGESADRVEVMLL